MRPDDTVLTAGLEGCRFAVTESEQPLRPLSVQPKVRTAIATPMFTRPETGSNHHTTSEFTPPLLLASYPTRGRQLLGGLAPTTLR